MSKQDEKIKDAAACMVGFSFIIGFALILIYIWCPANWDAVVIKSIATCAAFMALGTLLVSMAKQEIKKEEENATETTPHNDRH